MPVGEAVQHRNLWSYELSECRMYHDAPVQPAEQFVGPVSGTPISHVAIMPNSASTRSTFISRQGAEVWETSGHER